MEQLDLFTEIDLKARYEDHIKSMRCCWPEWEGPEVGGYCSVGECCPYHPDTNESQGYHYTERCKILEQRDEYTWIVKIDHSNETLDKAPWMERDNGKILVLDLLSIWAPTDDLWKERRKG